MESAGKTRRTDPCEPIALTVHLRQSQIDVLREKAQTMGRTLENYLDIILGQAAVSAALERRIVDEDAKAGTQIRKVEGKRQADNNSRWSDL